MAAIPSLSSWIPEDDLLLKDALEKGASFEALAKGAVRFSRKFTVGELQERWHSLLYDPVVSDKVAACLIQFELPVYSGNNNSSNTSSKVHNRLGNSVEPGHVSNKRKIESVRKLYYSLRKKMCAQNYVSSEQPFMSDDYVGISNVSECTANNECCTLGDDMGDPIGFQESHVSEFDYGGLSTLEDKRNGILRNCYSSPVPEKISSFSVKELVKTDCEHSFEQHYEHKDIPLWKTIEDVSPPAMPVHMDLGDRCEGAVERVTYPGDVDDDVDQNEPMLEQGCTGNEFGTSTGIRESDLVDLSDSLLNLTNDDGLPSAFVGGKDTVDVTCPLLSSSDDAREGDQPSVCKNQAAMSNSCQPSPVGSQSLEARDKSEVASTGQVNQHGPNCPEISIPLSASLPDTRAFEVHDEMMECVLNTEDSEIPCNDDFVPLKRFTPRLQPTYMERRYPSSKSYKEKLDYVIKGENHAQSSAVSWPVGQKRLSGPSPNSPFNDCGAKSELARASCSAILFRQANTMPAEQSGFRSISGTPKSSTGEVRLEELFHAYNVTNVPAHTEAGSMANSCPDSEAGPSLSDQEECESDADVPCFSDIEAMILEMDLCPDDQDQHINRKVLRYQAESTKRSIMRLEQCARSSMHRSIASRGAFGVFYGRNLKYYVKKTEVILGRTTEEMDVDIDLGREALSNKISRRQALIRMEGNGSFVLRNLGKNSIYLNGAEIARGQMSTLPSGSLIEIREMAFIFDINHKYVKQYLAKVAYRNQEKNSSFEWTPDGALG